MEYEDLQFIALEMQDHNAVARKIHQWAKLKFQDNYGDESPIAMNPKWTDDDVIEFVGWIFRQGR